MCWPNTAEFILSHFMRVAQLVERRSPKPKVASPNLVAYTNALDRTAEDGNPEREIMEDQTEQTENPTENSQTAEQPKETPTPSEVEEKPTDWQAKYEAMRSHSRKWEERAKANADAAEQLEKLKAQSDADSKTINDLKEKLTGYKHDADKRKWATEVSSKTGVPAELLDADSLEGMQAQAKKLAKYLRPKGLPGQGTTPAQEPAGNSAIEFTRRLFGNEN